MKRIIINWNGMTEKKMRKTLARVQKAMSKGNENARISYGFYRKWLEEV